MPFAAFRPPERAQLRILALAWPPLIANRGRAARIVVLSLSASLLAMLQPYLSKVLVDMSMDATILSSLDLGRLVIQDLSQVARIHQHEVDQAAFAVLKSPDIPSILVETGFMSNREDCKRLLTERHQDELAESLKSGVQAYFRKYPVHRAET